MEAIVLATGRVGWVLSHSDIIFLSAAGDIFPRGWGGGGSFSNSKGDCGILSQGAFFRMFEG